MNNTTNNNHTFGWLKFHMDYSFGANAGSLLEDWDSTRGTYYTLYRLLDARIARFYQVEPKSFPIVPFQFTLIGSMSPFSKIEGAIMATDMLYRESLKKWQKFPVLDYRLAWKIKKPFTVKYVPFEILKQKIIGNEKEYKNWHPLRRK